MPFGLTNQKSGRAPPAASSLSGPSSRLASLPVTRLITCRMPGSNVVKVADSPRSMPKLAKLWNRLPPLSVPSACGTVNAPLRRCTAPIVPSVAAPPKASSGVATSAPCSRARLARARACSFMTSLRSG
jgi:hypothetical protein